MLAPSRSTEPIVSPPGLSQGLTTPPGAGSPGAGPPGAGPPDTARWLARLQAAAYIGLSPATFDRLRKRKVDPIPAPRGITVRRLKFDRLELDAWVERQHMIARKGELRPRQPAPPLPQPVPPKRPATRWR